MHIGLTEPTADPVLLRARRLLIALLFFGTIINYVDRQVLSLLKPTISAEYGWGDAEFAHFASASQLAAAAALLVVGWIIDRFGVRLAYGTAVAFWSLAGIAHAVAATVSQFVMARVVLVAFEAVNTPAAVKSAALYLPLRQRTMALGIINTAPNLGNIIAPLAVVPFAVMFGWKAAFIVTGLLGFVWLAFWISGTRKLVVVPRASITETSQPKSSYREALADRRTWAIAGAKAITDMFWWFFTFWLPDLFNKVFSLSQSELIGPTALAFTMAAIGALSAGHVFGMFLKRGRSVNASRKLGMLVYACAVLPMPFALLVDSAWAAAAIIGLGLFAHQGFGTNIFGLAADAIPARRVATVIAIGAIAGNLTGFGIQEVTGWLLTAGYGYAPLFWAAAVAYMLALAWVHLLVPTIVAEDEGSV